MTYDFDFADGSHLSIPEPWRPAYDQRLRDVDPAGFAARLRFLTEKYVEHHATPSKFDGLGMVAEDDTRFDDPGFYFEPWDEPTPPTMAQVAEEVVYQIIRLALMQHVVDEEARRSGRPAIRVLTPEEFLRQHDHQAASAGDGEDQAGGGGTDADLA